MALVRRSISFSRVNPGGRTRLPRVVSMIKHVGLNAVEARGLKDGLVVEADVAGVEKGLRFAAHENSGGAESVAGIKEFERRRRIAGTAGFATSSPFDLAIVFEALELGLRSSSSWMMGEKRIFPDASLLPLADHDVDGVVQDASG
jgi:hypothetical protein